MEFIFVVSPASLSLSVMIAFQHTIHPRHGEGLFTPFALHPQPALALALPPQLG